MKKDILCLIGFSGSGKDTLLNILVEDCGFHRVISHTSRPKRLNETNRKEYHFVSKEKFLEMKEEFLEIRKYNTLVNNIPDEWFYGVHPESFSNKLDNCIILDLLGYLELKTKYPNRIISFFIEASSDVRKERIKLRGDYDEVEFNRRLKDDLEKFPKEVLEKEVDFIIQSGNINSNINEIIDNFDH